MALATIFVGSFERDVFFIVFSVKLMLNSKSKPGYVNNETGSEMTLLTHASVVKTLFSF